MQLRPGVSVTRPAPSFAVDPALVLRVKRQPQAQDPIVAARPDSERELTVTGILRELTREANPFKAFRIAEGSFGAVLLGPLSLIPTAKVTVHVPGLPGEPLDSYTVWMPRELLSDTRIRTGITVSLHLESLRIGKAWAWYCDDFQVIG